MTLSTKIIIGQAHGFHDASCSIIDTNGNILFAEQSERKTGIKHDKSPYEIPEIFNYDNITVFYEKPILRQLRQFISGENIRKITKNYDYYIEHHWAHAASSYYTRPWKEEPVCVVIDSIGEFDTASIWYKKRKVWSLKYPCSLGLFYSSITKYLGMIPNRDEHLTMALASLSNYDNDLLTNMTDLIYSNLHKGFPDKIFDKYDNITIASTAQKCLENEILKIMQRARKYSEYLCYSGGVALNCVANTKIHSLFKDSWIFPNPGDAGASFGAALSVLDKHIKFEHNYLGTDIDRKINPKDVAKHLLKYGVCGIANGRGEFGPRALGNRSLIADPRGNVGEKIYEIKTRNKWSPLAPIVLSECFDKYFEGPKNKYMSYVCKVKNSTDHLKMIKHVDDTARVQVIYPDSPSIIRKILEEWYELTACPILINTSLNNKGKPVVNNIEEINIFEKNNDIKVF
jgi:carbamoyltransferase